MGAVDDPLEREADRVADHVMRSPEPAASIAAAPPAISRKCEACEDDDKLRRRADGPDGHAGQTAPAVVDDVLRGAGQPLDAPTRAYFEPRFGRDFADVRLHVGSHAAESARAVNARAYTVGRDIVFGAGMFAPATLEGGRLLAHELTHVAQQAGATAALQRDPKPGKPDPKTKPGGEQKPEKVYPAYQSADSISEISRDNDTWNLTVEGATSAEDLRRRIWPRLAPPSVTITLKVAIVDPIERGWFTLTGLTDEAAKLPGSFAMEPSIAKLFAAHGLEDEIAESAAVKSARAAFRAQHQGHGEWVLDAIDVALRRITKRNPELLISYYNHYENHDLKDETHDYTFDGITFNPRKETGATARGNSLIHPDLLRLQPPANFPTDDPISLLAGTLLHEFTHTPQPSASDPVSKAQFEAKAYGVEVFFSERMGDKARADFIYRRSTNDAVDQTSGGDKIFDATQKVMEALYRMIDNGGPAAKQAKDMSVEFISKNSGDYGPKLKALIATIRSGERIP